MIPSPKCRLQETRGYTGKRLPPQRQPPSGLMIHSVIENDMMATNSTETLHFPDIFWTIANDKKLRGRLPRTCQFSRGNPYTFAHHQVRLRIGGKRRAPMATAWKRMAENAIRWEIQHQTRFIRGYYPQVGIVPVMDGFRALKYEDPLGHNIIPLNWVKLRNGTKGRHIRLRRIRIFRLRGERSTVAKHTRLRRVKGFRGKRTMAIYARGRRAEGIKARSEARARADAIARSQQHYLFPIAMRSRVISLPTEVPEEVPEETMDHLPQIKSSWQGRGHPRKALKRPRRS